MLALATRTLPLFIGKGFASFSSEMMYVSRIKAPTTRYQSALSSQPSIVTARPLVSTAAVASAAAATPSPKTRIGVIGAGQMGEALIRGFIESGAASAGRICASVATFERREALASLGIGNIFDDATTGGASDVAHHSDVIILGVKPQVMGSVLESLAPHIKPNHLIISIAAGVKLSTLEASLGGHARVVRVMPNTPCLVQMAASAYSLGTHATQEDADLVHRLFSSVGLAIQVQEKMMDAVTGLSGSGPAYVFLMVEALADGGVAAGLPRAEAQQLAAQTVAGAAKMVLETRKHPGALKDMVTSPAGTTITGLTELETSGVRGAFIRAVKAASKRSEELG